MQWQIELKASCPSLKFGKKYEWAPQTILKVTLIIVAQSSPRPREAAHKNFAPEVSAKNCKKSALKLAELFRAPPQFCLLERCTVRIFSHAACVRQAIW
jgi:hypothetical protein